MDDRPDLHRALFHQKLQMLQLCIRRASKAPPLARRAAPSSRLTPSAPAATDSGESDSEQFFDTVESASSADVLGASATEMTDGWDITLNLEEENDESEQGAPIQPEPPAEPPEVAESAPEPAVPTVDTARGRGRVLPGVFLQAAPTVPVYEPVTQEPTPMTEDVMEERVRLQELLGVSAEGAQALQKLQTATLLSGTVPGGRQGQRTASCEG